jgi:hypothetical protein
MSPFWLEFEGFVPKPTVSFKAEFNRLAKQLSWNAETRRQRKIEALTAEFNYHYGTCMDALDHWQQLCKDVDIKEIPTSITQCKKVRTQHHLRNEHS